MVIWILRHALAFAWFEDQILRGSFKLSNWQATLQTPTWADSMSKELYAGLSTSLIDEIKVFIVFLFSSFPLTSYVIIVFDDQDNGSCFCLVHNVWTYKRSKYAFIWVSSNFINQQWNYQISHLTLKPVTWNHYGVLLAQPVAHFLIKHRLHHQISTISSS